MTDECREDLEELKELVESAKVRIARRENSSARFPARWEMIELMLRGVPRRDISLKGDDDGRLRIEVKYQGVIFCIHNATTQQISFLSRIFS